MQKSNTKEMYELYQKNGWFMLENPFYDGKYYFYDPIKKAYYQYYEESGEWNVVSTPYQIQILRERNGI